MLSSCQRKISRSCQLPASRVQRAVPSLLSPSLPFLASLRPFPSSPLSVAPTPPFRFRPWRCPFPRSSVPASHISRYRLATKVASTLSSPFGVCPLTIAAYSIHCWPSPPLTSRFRSVGFRPAVVPPSPAGGTETPLGRTGSGVRRQSRPRLLPRAPQKQNPSKATKRPFVSRSPRRRARDDGSPLLRDSVAPALSRDAVIHIAIELASVLLVIAIASMLV
jgi:hypothetical protein